MADDPDPVSELRERLIRLDTSLAHVREGRTPVPPLDLLTWRADTRALVAANDERRGWTWQATMRALREDWRGLSEAIRDWAIRFEARLHR